jgi:dihydrofolate reductase
MGKIVISENLTLDAVIEDPTGEDGFKHGGWFNQITDHDREEWGKVEFAEALGAEAMLLGRRTYEYFAGRFPSRTGEWADRLNSMPKYVVSATLRNAQWNNSTVLTGDVIDAVAALKWQLAGEIVIYSSGRLAQALLEHDLVDELRLMIYPVVLGTGNRLFGATSDKKSLRLLETRTVGTSLALLRYAVG